MADLQDDGNQQKIQLSPTWGEISSLPRAPASVPGRLSQIRLFAVVVLGLVVLLGAGAGGSWLSQAYSRQQFQHARAQSAPCTFGWLSVNVSFPLQPLLATLTKQYSARCSQAVFTVNAAGSPPALVQLEAHEVGIALTDLPARSMPADLVDHPLIVATFGVMVNAGVGVSDLTTTQLRDIYTGIYTNWDQVGGPDLPIVVISRSGPSATRAIFEQYVLRQRETVAGISSLAAQFPEAGLVARIPEEEVSDTAGAIGYLPLSQFWASDKVRIIAINGSQPSLSNVEKNAYPFWNVEHLYTKGQPTSLEQALINSLDSPQGHVEEAALFCLPRSAIQPAALAAHNVIPNPI